jgi:hypothetical protein
VAVDLDEAALVGRCLAYVADPWPDRSRHRELFRVLATLEQFGLGPPAELLDALAVDGGTRREDAAALVSSWLTQATAEDGAGEPTAGDAAAGGRSPPRPFAVPAGSAAELPAVRITAGPTPSGTERSTATRCRPARGPRRSRHWRRSGPATESHTGSGATILASLTPVMAQCGRSTR